MTPVCLFDTNVVSETSKQRPNHTVLSYIQAQDAAIISALTLHEIVFGIERLPHGKKRDALSEWLSALKEGFDGRIIPIDAPIAETAASFRAIAHGKGWKLDVGDSFLAGTAHRLSVPIVTRNVKDFERLDLSVVNPWAL